MKNKRKNKPKQNKPVIKELSSVEGSPEVVCVELKIDASQHIQAESFRRPETLMSSLKWGQMEQKHRFIFITDR